MDEEKTSEDYPIGGCVEYYDIQREQDLLDKDDEVLDVMNMFKLF